MELEPNASGSSGGEAAVAAEEPGGEAGRERRPRAPEASSTGRVAAIDLGSNSFHMIVARLQGDSLQVEDRLREPVRLAGGLDAERMLTADAQQRALECLARFGQRVREIPAGGVRAVGTNTLRQARNGAPFLEQARAVFGHPIEIVRGREEARLIYLGAVRTTPGDGERQLVIDVGGGSTECILGQGDNLLEADSLFMGCVSYSGRFFRGGLANKPAFRAARLAAEVELQTIARPYRRLGWRGVLGCSGTILALLQIARMEGHCGEALTRRAVRKLRKAIVAAGSVDAVSLAGLQPDRRPVLPGGLAIVEAAFRVLGIDGIVPSLGALREGLLYDLVGRMQDKDVREATLARFCKRYGVDRAQAMRVEATALAAFDQVAADWGLGESWAGRMLSWAARLHEIGLAISHVGYHKHGAYVVMHSDLAGFSRDDQLVLAALIRAHRRKIVPSFLNAFGGERATLLLRLTVLLRLAVCLHRGRSSAPLPPLQLRARRQRLELQFPAEWLERHPLTVAVLEEEAAQLAPHGVELLVEAVG